MEYSQATAAIATFFDGRVHRAYQTGKLVANHTRMKFVSKAGVVNFPISGALASQERLGGRFVVTQSDNIDTVDAIVRDYDCAYLIHEEVELKTAYDDIDTAMGDIMKAIQRRCDQVAFAPMIEADKANTINVVANSINDEGADPSGLNLAKILQASAYLNANGVPQSDRYIAITAAALQDLQRDEKITSSDFNNLMPLMKGEVTYYNGFNFILIDERTVDEGGLPKGTVSNNKVDRTMFAWHKDAIGTAVNRNITTKTTYEGLVSGTLCNAKYNAGATLIDRKGLVAIKTNEDEIAVVGSTANLLS